MKEKGRKRNKSTKLTIEEKRKYKMFVVTIKEVVSIIEILKPFCMLLG